MDCNYSLEDRLRERDDCMDPEFLDKKLRENGFPDDFVGNSLEYEYLAQNRELAVDYQGFY